MEEMTKELHKGRMVIVSNRLPVVISKEEGQIKTEPGTGGLVTALAPVLQNRGGLWIGWPGAVDEADQDKIRELLQKNRRKFGFILHPIFLTEEEGKLYYEGFANEIIWPLFHDLQSLCRFDATYWTAVQNVNQKFAEGIQSLLKKDDFIWIHDYHLMLVGQGLRKLGVTEKIGFFLHIPFPSLDIFVKLPWRFQVLRALLEYDLVGFQTTRDVRNFLACVKRLLPDVKIANKRNMHTCQIGDREVRVGAFPISIDFKEFSKAATSEEVEALVKDHRSHYKGKKIIFSCDRLDMSKGIPYRLEAIRYLLKNHPEIHEKVTFFQVVVPSRTEIPRYHELKEKIDRRVGEINSEFTKPGWVPIHYIFHAVSRAELIAYYRISDIALITPVKDGMNLVAKEYIASNIDENGVLVMSEFAGAVTQLQHEALLVNPYDVVGVAEAIYTGLIMTEKERRVRMRKMRRNVQRYDVFWWLRLYLNAAITKELLDFPIIEEYNPSNHAPAPEETSS